MEVRDPYDRLIGDPKLFVLNLKFSLETNSRFSIETPWLFIGAANFLLKTLDFSSETPNISPKPQIFREETTICSFETPNFLFNLKYSDLQNLRSPLKI